MGYFPMCISLKGKHILLVGEGNVAKEKLNILQSFDADIYIFSNLGFSDPEPNPAYNSKSTLFEERLPSRTWNCIRPLWSWLMLLILKKNESVLYAIKKIFRST